MSKIKSIQNQILNKEKTIKNIVDEYISIIRRNEDKNNEDEFMGAVIEIMNEDFINKQIQYAEGLFANNKHTSVTGIPIAIKNNICIDGVRTTAGSRMLENYTATYNATVINKLRDAGAIIIATTNMDEFAMGSSGENSAFYKTRNSIDKNLVPGGSSSGSASIVGYGGVPVSLGSDTGGSVRQPAAFNGIIGMKPSYGAVSRYGLISMGSSLDSIGPIATDIEDAKIVFDIIRGQDDKDATSVNYENNIKRSKIIAVPEDFINRDGMDEDIKNNFYKYLDNMKSRGYEIKNIKIDNLDKILSVYYIICLAEVSSNLGRYDGIRYGKRVNSDNPMHSIIESRTSGLGDEPIRRSLIGAFVLSSGYSDEYYYKAIDLRNYLRDEIRRIFQDVDYIAMPTSPVPPWRFGEKSDPISAYLADIFTVLPNVISMPAISIPSGVDKNNLPTAIQFMADIGNDDILFEI